MKHPSIDAESHKRFLKHVDECPVCSRFIRVAWDKGKARKYLSGMEWRNCRTVQLLFDEFDVPPDISEATW